MKKETLAEPPDRALKLRTANPLYGSFCSLCVLSAQKSISDKKGSGTMPDMVPYGKNLAIVIPMEDDLLHAVDKPFCWDSTCGCHRDETLFRQVQQFVLNGELTPHEAMLFIAGKTV